MANLAQTVNVLQSLILTKGPQMVLTPTYHVFDLFQVHQDAKWLPINLQSPDYSFGGESIPAVNASASQDKSGAVHISLVNLDPNNKITVSAAIASLNKTQVSGRVLTSGHFTDINSFDQPNKVKIEAFQDAKLQGGNLQVTLPPSSVVVLELK
jgi:alpha-N-arabinofuranosidase